LRRNGSDHAGRKSLRLLYLSAPLIAAVLAVLVALLFVLGHLA
jgi:hypothetical protein